MIHLLADEYGTEWVRYDGERGFTGCTKCRLIVTGHLVPWTEVTVNCLECLCR